jgi:hypothetical protein
MRLTRLVLLASLVGLAAGAGCTLSFRPAPTPTPLPPPTQTPIPPLVEERGTISGEIRQPGAAGSGLRVYARELTTGQVTYIDVPDGATTFTIPDLPVGTYIVAAWFYPGGVSGGYTALDTLMAEGTAEQEACTTALIQIPLAPGENYHDVTIACWGGDFFDLVQ